MPPSAQRSAGCSPCFETYSETPRKPGVAAVPGVLGMVAEVFTELPTLRVGWSPGRYPPQGPTRHSAQRLIGRSTLVMPCAICLLPSLMSVAHGFTRGL